MSLTDKVWGKKLFGPVVKVLVAMINDLRVLLVVYVLSVVVASVILAFVEGWTLHEASWVSRVTALTIGYGDNSPATPQGRMVMMIFAHFWAWVMIPSIILNLFIKGVRDAGQWTHREQEYLIKGIRAIAARLGVDPGEEPGDTDHGDVLHGARKSSGPLGRLLVGMVNNLWLVIVIYVVTAIVAAAVLRRIEPGTSFGDWLWFAPVTGLTIGYGDVTPQSWFGREVALLFAHFWIMIVQPSIIANILVKGVRSMSAWTHREQEHVLGLVGAIGGKLGLDLGSQPGDTDHGDVDAQGRVVSEQ